MKWHEKDIDWQKYIVIRIDVFGVFKRQPLPFRKLILYIVHSFQFTQHGGVVNNQIEKRFIAESVSEKKFKIGEYLVKLQARTWLSRALVRLANTLLNDGESARDNHVLACNFDIHTYMYIQIYIATKIVRTSPMRNSPHLCLATRPNNNIIVKKLNSLKHLVRTTLAESHN